jgi:hypothetical protein
VGLGCLGKVIVSISVCGLTWRKRGREEQPPFAHGLEREKSARSERAEEILCVYVCMCVCVFVK